jgi:hypothetical protein
MYADHQAAKQRMGYGVKVLGPDPGEGGVWARPNCAIVVVDRDGGCCAIGVDERRQ